MTLDLDDPYRYDNIWQEIMDNDRRAPGSIAHWDDLIEDLPVLSSLLDTVGNSAERAGEAATRIAVALEPVRAYMPDYDPNLLRRLVAFRSSDQLTLAFVTLASDAITVGVLRYDRDADQIIANTPRELAALNPLLQIIVPDDFLQWSVRARMTYSIGVLLRVTSENPEFFSDEENVVGTLDRTVTDLITHDLALSHIMHTVLLHVLEPTDLWTPVWFVTAFSAVRAVALTQRATTPAQRTQLLKTYIVVEPETFHLALLLIEQLYEKDVVRMQLLSVADWPTRLMSATKRAVLLYDGINVDVFGEQSASLVDALIAVKRAMLMLQTALPRDFAPIALAIRQNNEDNPLTRMAGRRRKIIAQLLQRDDSLEGVLILQPRSAALLQTAHYGGADYQRCVVLDYATQQAVGFYLPGYAPFDDLDDVRLVDAHNSGVPRADLAITQSALVRGAAFGAVLEMTLWGMRPGAVATSSGFSSMLGTGYLSLAAALARARASNSDDLRDLQRRVRALDPQHANLVLRVERAMFTTAASPETTTTTSSSQENESSNEI
jgi:hypothetical protein